MEKIRGGKKGRKAQKQGENSKDEIRNRERDQQLPLKRGNSKTRTPDALSSNLKPYPFEICQ